MTRLAAKRPESVGNWYGLLFELLFSGAVIAFILWELYTLRRDSKRRDKTDKRGD